MATEPAPPTSPALILDLIEAFRRSKTMFAAVQLGVFDGKRGGGAEFTRLLDACVALGLLERTGDEYANTPAADTYLRTASPESLGGYVRYSNRALYPLWGALENAVSEGTHRWHEVFGFDGGSLFEHFFRDEATKRDFLLGMHGFGRLSSPAVVAAFDLSRFHRLIDLGGATGHLAIAAKHLYPHLEVAVLDLGPAVEFGREISGDQVEWIAADFFADPLPPADLYSLGRILHDWSEDKIGVLLRKIFDVLPAGGALLVAEKLLDPAHVPGHMQSLNMLVCTEGRERSADEYAGLLRTAGFSRVESKRTGAPLDATLASK